MEELIKITEHNNKQAVSARELHRFLGATERFSTWIERQFQYGFIEGQDYVGRKEFNTLANQELNDFVLTIDTSKEISMLQKSEKGKLARQYFIECEKKSLNPYQNISKLDALRLAVEAEEKAERLQLEIETKHKPRSEFVDQVFNSDSLIAMSQVAKILGLDFGRNTLYKKLREKGVLFKSTNEPKQTYVNKGYFKLKENTFTSKEGETKVSLQTFVTQKGLAYIAKIFQVITLPVNSQTKTQISA